MLRNTGYARSAQYLLAGLVLVSAVGCATPAPPPPQAAPALDPPYGVELFHSPDSIWRTPVPSSAAIDPHSAAYVARFAGPEPTVALRNYTAPIFAADEHTPHYPIAPTASYSTPEATLSRVPIPDNAKADPGTDGHLAVLDRSSNCLYEMYRARKVGGVWTAEWVNGTPAEGNGIYPDGLATRASGISIGAGLIWPEELNKGEIDHALVFAYPYVATGGPVAPATRSDGTITGPDALPEGAHLVLDPDLDLSTLKLTGPELTIARALQTYGMYLADSSRGLSLFAVHPQSYEHDPYADLFGAGDDNVYAGIGAIPFDKMKVLQLGKRTVAYHGPVTPNRCTDAVR